MKKFWLPLSLAIALPLVSASALADLKVGVLNLQEIMQKSPKVQQINDDLKKQFGPREKKIADAQDKFKKDFTNFEKNKSVMKAADVKAAQKKLTDEQQSLQQMQISFQQDVMQAQNQQVNSFLEQIKTIVNNIAKKDNYNLILTNSGPVSYVDPKLDVTQEVMDDLSKKK